MRKSEIHFYKFMYFHWIFELILLNSKKIYFYPISVYFVQWILIQYSVYESYKLWIQWNLETLNDENNIDKIIDFWSDESTALLKCQLIF